jgi:hypothetical protein
MIEREYYKLEEASKVLGCKISDLLHLGATGKIRLSIYVDYYNIYDVMRVGDESKRYGFHSYLGLPDELKPAQDNIYDLPKQNAIQLEHNGVTQVVTVFCRNDTVVSSRLGSGEGFYTKEDLLIVRTELNNAMAFIPPTSLDQSIDLIGNRF